MFCILPRSQRPREHPSKRHVREKRRDASVPLFSSLLSLPLPSSPVPLPVPQSSASGGRAPVLHPGRHIQRTGRVPGRPSPLLGGEQLGGGGPGAQWPHTDPAQPPTLPGQQRHTSVFDLFTTGTNTEAEQQIVGCYVTWFLSCFLFYAYGVLFHFYILLRSLK